MLLSRTKMMRAGQSNRSKVRGRAAKSWAFAALLLAGCVSEHAPPAQPLPHRTPQPHLAQRGPALPVKPEWEDLPVAEGGWTWRSDDRESAAFFAPAGAAPLFSVACDRGSKRVTLTRSGTPAAAMLTLRTSYGGRSLPADPAGDALSISGRLSADDPLFDEIAFSRGHFSVETGNGSMLVLPSWPEPARAIEDCRGEREGQIGASQ